MTRNCIDEGFVSALGQQGNELEVASSDTEPQMGKTG